MNKPPQPLKLLEPLLLCAKDAAKLCGISRAQWWKLLERNKLPEPVYLGQKAPRWRVTELRTWVAAGCPDAAAWKARRNKCVAVANV